jgi:hypothetical protein
MPETPLTAVPDPDDPDHVDPDDLALVESLLRGLSDLRPADAPRGGPVGSDDPMPEAVWQQLATALAAQSVARPAAGGTRTSRTARWAGGLVAASVAVVAIGVAATVLRSGGGTAVVAGEVPTSAAVEVAKVAPPTPSALAASAFAAAEAAPPAPSTTAGADQAADSTSADSTAGGVQPAARVVLDSQTAYQPATLRTQVSSMVKDAGFATLREAMTKQPPTSAMPVEGGFTGSWQRLRDCVTRLTSSDQKQALVVDRGTYSGVDAGVVVASTDAEGQGASASSPPPTAVLATPVGTFDVWVVDPECEQVAATLDDFDLYAWQP